MDIHDLEYTEAWEWPAEASREILRVLKDKGASEEDRALAASLAGDFVVINDELAGELMTVLQDPYVPVPVRANAAIAFGPALEHSDCCDWSDEDDVIVSEEVFDRMRQTLRAVCLDESAPKEVRRRALEAAVRAPEEWQKAVILKAFKLADTEWKATAVFGMGYVDGFDDEILASLDSPEPEIVYEAVRAAGMHELADAWPEILDILRSKTDDRHLLLAAIEAAPYVNALESVNLLQRFAMSDDEEIAETADEALQVASWNEDPDEMMDDEEDEFETEEYEEIVEDEEEDDKF